MVQIKVKTAKEEPAPEKEEVEKKREIARFKTGISKLDEALEGGIPMGSWVVVAGEPGTGKTVLTQHAVKSAIDQGWYSVVVSTELKKWEWMEQSRSLGISVPEDLVVKLDDVVEYRVRKEERGRVEVEIDTDAMSKAKVAYADIYTLYYLSRILSQREEEKTRRWYSYLDSSVLNFAVELALRGFSKEEGKISLKSPVLIVVDSISMFYLKAPSMAAKYVLDLSLRFKKYNTIALLTAQYAWTTRSTYGARIEHVADGVFHFWMDNVEATKEIRRYMIIKKMRMTQHTMRAFRVIIEKGKGMILEPIG